MVSREIFLVGKMIKFWLVDEILATFPGFPTKDWSENMTEQTSSGEKAILKERKFF